MTNKTALQIEADAAQWLARKDGGHWNATLQAELDAWLELSLAHRVAYLRLASTWSRADRLRVLHAATSPARGDDRALRVASRGWRPATHHRGLLATCLALLILLGWTGWVRWVDWESQQGTQYATAVGVQQRVTLPDGSTVLLNTDSKLRTTVTDANRTAWLDRGEAYFEIAHDRARPFVVMAGDQQITVIGTKFAVRRRQQGVDVIVEEGRVQVQRVEGTASSVPVVLTRNQKVLSDAQHSIVVSEAQAKVAEELSWRQGRIAFDQTPLEDVANEFNRYNRKKLVIEGTAARRIRIGGSFAAGNVGSFATLLKMGFGLQVQESADQIKVTD